MTENILGEIAERKRRDVQARLAGECLDPEPTRRSLRAALSRPGARFIMEVKKASPSGHRGKADVGQAVRAYAPVADAISVLTDEPYFSGSLDDLRAVRKGFNGPILAKDFIVDARQVTEARLHGADAVLGILAMIDDEEARALMAEARRLAMDVIVEVHDKGELRRALALGADIIGINNRDLRTLRTDLAVTEHLADMVPADCIAISESGVHSRADVERLSRKVDAFLVGSSLMASRDIFEAARALIFGSVKLCGLKREDDVATAAEAGATHAGLIFAEASLRRVRSEAPALAEKARRHGLKPVGVFQDQELEVVARMAHDLGLGAVQLHGRETYLQSLRDALPADCEIWAACAVDREVGPEREGADRILYDTGGNGPNGGTGRQFDWSLLQARPSLASAFIAGGLSAENARAARQVGAYGLDVNSGVETAPGRKDPAKVQALFDALRPDCRRTEKCA